MRAIIFPALVACASLWGGSALADPAYTATDIINHFAPATELGATRSICIGTEAECGTVPAGKAEVESYDLLVTFDLNSDGLTESARANLDEFAKALKDPKLASASFEVDGHTDARGSEEYNLGLSERRAKAVVQYLTAQGVDPAKLVPKGFGKSSPRVDDPFAAENRRVETRLVVQ